MLYEKGGYNPTGVFGIITAVVIREHCCRGTIHGVNGDLRVVNHFKLLGGTQVQVLSKTVHKEVASENVLL